MKNLTELIYEEYQKSYQETERGEFYPQWLGDKELQYVLKAAKEYAEMHVKEALKQAAEKAEVEVEYENPITPSFTGEIYVVNKESILNAYLFED